MNRPALTLVAGALLAPACQAQPAPAYHSSRHRLEITARHILYAPVRRPRSLRLDEGDVAVDTHVHTEFSPDSRASISNIILQAVRRRLTAIAITDHNTMDALSKAQGIVAGLQAQGRVPVSFFLIPGEEISTREGHIIALYIRKAIAAQLTARETIARIHLQGGLAVAAHPMDKNSLGRLALELPFDGVETMNGAEETAYLVAKAPARERRAAFYKSVTAPRYGGSDAHDPRVVGICYTILRDCDGSPAAVRAALFAGQTEACDVPGFIARTRGMARRGRWLTWTPRGLPESGNRDMTPMLRLPIRTGSLTLRLNSGVGVLYQRRF